jgi:hypothetical protein
MSDIAANGVRFEGWTHVSNHRTRPVQRAGVGGFKTIPVVPLHG